MDRILLLGGSGILGTEVLAHLKNNLIEYLAPRSSDLDIRREDLINNLIQDFNPTWIVNCAGWTDVEGAENSFEEACELNEKAVKKIGIAAKKNNCKIIHISTDYVFDGESEIPYDEDSLVNPINKYGESKLRGEIALFAAHTQSYVVRTSWLYGLNGKNFVKTMAKKALRGEISTVVDDQVGSPTSARDLAAGVISIIKTQPSLGIYNFSNEGSCSWFELAKIVYEKIGADPELVLSIDTNSLNLKAKRPEFSILNKDKWRAANLSQVPDWKSSIELMMPDIATKLRQEREA